MCGNFLRRVGKILIFIFILPIILFAETPYNLKEIVVTAEKTPTIEKNTSKFVTIITSQELKETGANNLIDALRRFGGLNYKAFGPLGVTHGGMNSDAVIRGIYGGELVLINGMPVQAASSKAYDLNMIDIEQIDRVEIIKGAASTLYGADAMSGVINIITKKGSQNIKAKISAEGGDYQYNKDSINFSSKYINAGGMYQHLGGQRVISRSFSRKYHYNTEPINLNSIYFSLFPIKNLSVDFMNSHEHTVFKKFNDNIKPGAPLLLSKNTQTQNKYFIDLKYSWKMLSFKSFYYHDYLKYGKVEKKYSKKKKKWYTSSSITRNKVANSGAELNYKFNIFKTEFLAGADFIHRRADYNLKYGERTRDDYSIYLQVKKEFLKKLSITLGAREQFINGHQGADDYNKFLPSLGVVYSFNKYLNFYGNVGKAFKAPTFNNLYYHSTFLVGNPNLDPEKGWTYEIGAKYTSELMYLRVALFRMDYDDKIELDRSKGYPLTYYNAGDYSSQGIEWDLDYSLLSNFRLKFTGFWADPKAEAPDGTDYQVGPKLQITYGAIYDNGKLFLNLYSTNILNRERDLRDYVSWNFYSKFNFFKNFYLTFSVDNIFDRDNDVSGDRSLKATNNYVYYDTPRIAKIGLEYKW